MRRFRGEAGASAVEFAVVLPLLLLLLFGIVQFGLVFARVQGMEAAAREGARLASLGRDVQYGQVREAVLGTAPPFIRVDHLEVRVFALSSPGDDGVTDGVEYGAADGGWCTADPADTSPGRLSAVEVRVGIRERQRDRYAPLIRSPIGRSSGSGGPFGYEARGVFRCEAPHADS